MSISTDAIIFGLAYLRGPKSKLSFGGDGAKMAITPRARAALSELLTAGYAAPAQPDDSIPNRECYRGTDVEPHLGALAQAAGISPLDTEHGWPTFSKVGGEPGQFKLEVSP